MFDASKKLLFGHFFNLFVRWPSSQKYCLKRCLNIDFKVNMNKKLVQFIQWALNEKKFGQESDSCVQIFFSKNVDLTLPKISFPKNSLPKGTHLKTPYLKTLT